MTKKERDEIRNALADYMFAEGCSCCRDYEGWEVARARLGDLLGVPAEEGWHDFSQFRTQT